MKTLEKKLLLLAEWLKDSSSGIDPYHDGALESAIKYAKQEVKQEIGDLLEEILNINEDSITDD
jgi:hypothetical protein